MSTAVERTPPATLARLCVMMFIQYGVWSFWLTTMHRYLGEEGLGFAGDKIGYAYSTTGWGAILAPFLVGMIADRFFPAQIVMGVLHLATAALLWSLASVTEPIPFILILLAAMSCYMPTLALANSIGFEHVRNAEFDFPFIRTFSPMGWIAAGLVVGSLPSIVPAWFGGKTDIEPTVIPFQLSAVGSLIMGLYSFTLPHTPPKAQGKKATFADIAGLKTLALMKDRSFAVFVACSLLLCIPTSFYFQSANAFFKVEGMEQPASKMVLAQVSDVVFLAMMPFCLKRLGIKGIILVGLASWVVRYALFAAGAGHHVMWPYYVGILVHGMCYDFFFLAGQIYVDQRAPREVRSNAQGFISLVTLGIGMTIGNILNGYVANWVSIPGVNEKGQAIMIINDWRTLWIVPAAIAAVVGVIFLALFHERPTDPEPTADDEPLTTGAVPA